MSDQPTLLGKLYLRQFNFVPPISHIVSQCSGKRRRWPSKTLSAKR